jgi:hypothetical protein
VEEAEALMLRAGVKLPKLMFKVLLINYNEKEQGVGKAEMTQCTKASPSTGVLVVKVVGEVADKTR